MAVLFLSSSGGPLFEFESPSRVEWAGPVSIGAGGDFKGVDPS